MGRFFGLKAKGGVHPLGKGKPSSAIPQDG